ncbi:MAG TPA: helix-turn-helix domain-containing protein [Firmicutes bacterium]|nr:helix-turn-helix domain-containing protein [Bacillota bacterium]
MGIDYKLIGSRIKLKRKAAGKTQEQLAEKLSVTVGYVSQLERGVTKISLDTLSEICYILNCDMSFFIAGTATGEISYLQDELIEKYSSLTQVQKRIILEIIDVLIKNSEDKSLNNK